MGEDGFVHTGVVLAADCRVGLALGSVVGREGFFCHVEGGGSHGGCVLFSVLLGLGPGL